VCRIPPAGRKATKGLSGHAPLGAAGDKSSADSHTSTRSQHDSPTPLREDAGHRPDRVFEPNRFGTDTAGCRQLLRAASQWPQRVWAVEGASGIGCPVAQRLLADGERVLDVPAKLAARVRVSGTGQGRKTDAADAHAIVMVALRDKGLQELGSDPELMVLRLLRPP
jgi:Transposase